jgi:hypothetical protein
MKRRRLEAMDLLIASLVLGLGGLLAFRIARTVFLRTFSIGLAAIVELLRVARFLVSLDSAQ